MWINSVCKTILETIKDGLKEFWATCKKAKWAFVGLGLYFSTIGLYAWHEGYDTMCPIKMFTGIPCPGCGMTRAYIALLHLDFKKAFRMHPLFILPILVLAAYLYRGKTCVKKIIKNRWILGLVVFLIFGVYFLRMWLYFPEVKPMNYLDGNISQELFQKINGLVTIIK